MDCIVHGVPKSQIKLSDFHSLTKLSLALPYYLAITHLGIYPTDLKTYPNKNFHRNIYSSFVHNQQKLEATKMLIAMSFNRQIVKQTVVCPCNGILFSN